ncbi:NAD(P)/FAD-dependent oxidoreductase [Salipiger sp. 1_MG-2023]|uniref:NAD(P)/FAD-dependent oxidoreductase n=1 Tax=Salipiger sp. 1_MG-2023 TaxID=3062665 RepID=UPI0026E1D122|nr:NAD(P)/FAD-dependent oxidoreductase [Salipiger sp. 1_MG-2023]MDO6587107.1 NAD(P)/FAD-dependent oxidoreductase [Salipiger sp. 1_MG-2023]
MDKKHHVVVVGGGFGGLACVRDLKGDNLRITLVDSRNHHLFQPLLYQVATSILPTSEIAWPLRHLLRDRPEVETLMAEVTGVDAATQTLRFEDGGSIHYDTLVLATGARHSYFGHDDWETAAPGLKTLEDATAIRRRMLSAFEAAERSTDPQERAALLTFAVVGAGPTGVELVGIIAELAQRILPREFRHIDTREARVMLVEAGPRVLAAFPEDLSAYTKQALEKLGVEVLCGTAVTACDEDAITIGDARIPARTSIWAAGVKASRAAQWLDVEGDRAGRVPVGSDLTVAGHPEIFVIGDTAAVTNVDGKPVPGVAPAAKQQGEYVARLLAHRICGKSAPGPFRYRHKGSLATIGRKAAVADFGRIKLKGTLAWWVWGLAHIYFLIGTRNRVAVVWSWFWSHTTGQSSARLITQGKQGLAVPKAPSME